MHRFSSIEGLRAWLAWIVVLSHIGQSVDIQTLSPHWVWLDRAGHTAVLVFIAISGFVICNLVLDRREPWLRYIVRRGFRIFPAYWVAFAAALMTLPLGIAGAEHTAWAQAPGHTWDDVLLSWQTNMQAHPSMQMALHLTLLQGLVPDSVWPYTATAVLGPAWSLSLEWQFYLIAPAFIALLATKRWRLATIIGVAALAIMAQRNVFGDFVLPSFLPGSAYFFMIGIGCRLGFESLSKLDISPSALAAPLVLGVLYPEMLWLGVWLAFIGVLANEGRWTQSETMPRIAHAALSSRLATYLGARSYAVYLCHLPLLELAHWFLTTHFALNQTQMALALAAVLLPSTLLTSEALHRLVERPFMRLGARLTASRA